MEISTNHFQKPLWQSTSIMFKMNYSQTLLALHNSSGAIKSIFYCWYDFSKASE